ncbi:MAG: hypothetical protein WCF18_25710 [Chthoniobacteraceae bacterium]
MKLPNPRGFAVTSPSATVCDHVANFSARGKRAIELPEPADLAFLYDLPKARPYVRMHATPSPIPASGTWSVDRPEPKKIPMSYSPPRWKQSRNGPREEKWLLILETVTVTVTMPRGSYTLTACNRGNNVLDSRDESRRSLPEIRRELARVLGTAQADAACDELGSVMPGLRAPRAAKVREVSAADRARMEAVRNDWEAIESEQSRRRADRKANPPAKDDVPKYEEMTAEAFAAFNAMAARQSAQALAFRLAEPEREVERVHETRAIEFPAPFAE